MHSVLGTKQCAQRITLLPLALNVRVDLVSSCALKCRTELGWGKVNYSGTREASLRHIEAFGFSPIRYMMVISYLVLEW
ncbi:hypothetical protein [Paraglaciecola sp.]|uniref:hypothetical protein n=1 Tax=Paraglaciecola sp. TaxID=1920173 RepID=UPI0030F4090D